MVDYKVITNRAEKDAHRESVQRLFNDIFSRPLPNTEWEHLILSSPYDDGALILGLENDAVVATANLVSQKLNLGAKVLDYYLFTTSMVSKDHAGKGLYFKTIELIKDVLRSSKKDFIFALPNSNSYPLLTKLFQFKTLAETSLVKVAELPDLRTMRSETSLTLDKSFLDWRFEHKEYFWSKLGTNTLICKEYGGSYDVLEVLAQADAAPVQKRLPERSTGAGQNFNIMRNRLGRPAIQTVGDAFPLRPVYFSFDQLLDLSGMDLSLLMWDVI